MKKISHILLIISVFFCSVQTIQAQRYEIGVNGGASFCLGDINPAKLFIESDYTFGVFSKYNVNRRIAIKASINYAKFHSSDAVSKEDLIRDAWFKSEIIDASILGEFNFFPFFIGARENYWTPYLAGGISAAIPLSLTGGFNNTYTFDKNGLYSQTETIESKKNVIAPNLAIGFGIKLSLSKNFGMHLEWVMHKTFVDWLDGIYYYNNRQYFADNNILDVCNTYNREWYSMTQIGISYKFKIREEKKCVEHTGIF